MTTSNTRLASALIAALMILQTVMLISLYSRTVPHPPEVVAPFAIAPFLAAALAIAAGALILGAVETQPGRAMSMLTGAMALVSYGPQKYVDAQFGLIRPSVITGQIAVVCLFLAVWRARRPVMVGSGPRIAP